MRRIATWWKRLETAVELADRANRPWEQEGPLRWRRPVLGSWELWGSTLPAEAPMRT